MTTTPTHTARHAAVCPRCGAKPGEACRTPAGLVTKPHYGRPGAWHLLGPTARTIIAMRRAGTLQPDVSPRVYAMLLRAAVEADRINRDGRTRAGQ